MYVARYKFSYVCTYVCNAVLYMIPNRFRTASTILLLFIGPYAAFSMKALARYQVILLGEQRYIRCEQLAQGCCPIMLRPESNSRPLDDESNALTLHYRATSGVHNLKHGFVLRADHM